MDKLPHLFEQGKLPHLISHVVNGEVKTEKRVGLDHGTSHKEENALCHHNSS